MNPDDQELQKLEQFLRQLTPAEPSEQLTARIYSAFELPADAAPAEFADSRPAVHVHHSWSQPFAAAAAVALVAGIIAIIGLNRPAADPVGPGARPASNSSDVTVDRAVPVSFVPAHAENSYRGSNDDEIIFTEEGRPLRVVRHQFMDTYIWVNPEDGSRVEIRFPVERIRYVPVPTD